MFLKKISPPQQGIDYIIVGLGNPGERYEYTRHNVGFMAVDMLAGAFDIKLNRVKFKSICGDGIIAQKRVLLLKPTTYMNLSGEAVRAAMEYYKVPIENVIVLFDDVSLEPGKLRIRKKGSHGGHNGIKSIILTTGYDNFPRIKIGVGAKPHPDYDLADWVLSRFSKEHLKAVTALLAQTPKILELIISGDIEQAMNLYN